jgi:hypothetical protein
MKHLFIGLTLFFFLSCNSTTDKKDTNRLKQWIDNNQDRLKNDIENSIQKWLILEKRDSNWNTVSIATRMNAANSLGTLAKIAGDSTECIVVEFTAHKDKTRKNQIMIAAEDSSCLDKLNAIELETDSIGNLIFGKRSKPFSTNDESPLF